MNYNKYALQDIKAFKQLLQPFIQRIKVERSSMRGFNAKGRKNDDSSLVEIDVAITPGGSKIDVSGNAKGHGEWTSADYTATVVYPDRLYKGEIIHTVYGRLRVMQSDDTEEYGVCSYSLVRTGSTETVLNKQDSYLNDDLPEEVQP